MFIAFFVAEVFTGFPGKLVSLEATIKGFDSICKGEYDHLPEAAFYMVGGIEEAVEKAFELAKVNGAILLSPACASFDLFENYEERGNQFKRAVRAL